VWAAVLAAIQTAWGFIKGVFNAIQTAIGTLIGWFKNLPGNITAALATIWQVISAPFRAAWAWVRDHVFGPLVNFFKNLPRNITQWLLKVDEAIMAPFRAAWHWIQDHVIDPFVNFFKNLPSNIHQWLLNVDEAIINVFRSAWEWVRDHVFKPIVDFFKNLPGNITGFLSGLWDAITAPFKAAWDWINDNVFDPLKDAWNSIAKTWNSVEIKMPKIHIPLDGDIGGWTIGLPDLPTFASGAFVDGPTLAMIGEGNAAEFVTPEPMLRRLIRQETGSGGSVVINVTGALDPDAVARQIEKILTGRSRRVGGVRQVGTVGA
jgi:cation transport regulator ChaB